MNDNQNLTDDQLIDQITDKVFERILAKIAKDLSQEDIEEIERLNKDDKSGKQVKRYLYEKAPNFETIIFEELQQLRKQASA
jgi:hypothetical protein